MSGPTSRIRYGNRIIQQKEDNLTLQKHYQGLRRARPMTGKTCQKDTIQINNKKRDMLQQNRFTEIERQNRMLFHKITSIMNKGTICQSIGPRVESGIKMNKTLNGGYRKKQLQTIEHENAKMLKRLKQRKSLYQVSTLNRQWQKNKQVIKRISMYPFILDNTPGTMCQKVSNQFLLGGNLEHNNIRRIRKINGVIFLVTIRFQHDKLYIIGDMRNQENVKTIQLATTEGQDFIAEECGGNVEKVFDLLKYDRETGDLYLVGRDVGQLEEIKGLEKAKQVQRVQRQRAFTQHGRRANHNANQQSNLLQHNKTAHSPQRQLLRHLLIKKKTDLPPNQNQQQINDNRIVHPHEVESNQNCQQKNSLDAGNKKTMADNEQQINKQLTSQKSDIEFQQGSQGILQDNKIIQQNKNNQGELVKAQGKEQGPQLPFFESQALIIQNRSQLYQSQQKIQSYKESQSSPQIGEQGNQNQQVYQQKIHTINDQVNPQQQEINYQESLQIKQQGI